MKGNPRISEEKPVTAKEIFDYLQNDLKTDKYKGEPYPFEFENAPKEIKYMMSSLALFFNRRLKK